MRAKVSARVRQAETCGTWGGNPTQCPTWRDNATVLKSRFSKPDGHHKAKGVTVPTEQSRLKEQSC